MNEILFVLFVQLFYIYVNVSLYFVYQDLVENNPNIAVEVLIKLMNSPEIKECVSKVCYCLCYYNFFIFAFLFPPILPSTSYNLFHLLVQCRYFTVLLNMDMSLHSMEVVNSLTTVVDLPSDFVRMYVKHCISSCENIQVNSFDFSRMYVLACLYISILLLHCFWEYCFFKLV